MLNQPITVFTDASVHALALAGALSILLVLFSHVLKAMRRNRRRSGRPPARRASAKTARH